MVRAGCGSAAEPSAAVETHPLQFAHALCATLFRCCALPGDRQQLVRWSGNPPDQAFCEDAIAQSLTDRLPRLMESLSAGRIRYSEPDTRACLTALEKVSCENFGWSSAYPTRGCWAFTGRVPNGSGCVDSTECAEGRCDGAGSTCAPSPAAGERCFAGCRVPLVCDGVCVPLGNKTVGTPCASSLECVSHLCGPQANSNTATCAPVQACGFFP